MNFIDAARLAIYYATGERTMYFVVSNDEQPDIFKVVSANGFQRSLNTFIDFIGFKTSNYDQLDKIMELRSA